MTNEQILSAAERAISESDSPIATTEEIAELVGSSGETVRQRVVEIEALNTKKIGGDGPRIYWISD